MKLVHPDFFFPIEFKENIIKTVIIENPHILMEFICELRNQILEISDGKWILSDNTDIIEISKKSCFILDPFNIELNNKKMISTLYNKIDNDVNNTDLLLKWNELLPHLFKVLQQLTSSINYSLSYADDINIKGFLKFMNLKFGDESQNYFEKLLDYIRLTHEVLDVDLFIFMNIKTMLTREQMKCLYEQSCYDKYQILLFEAFDNPDGRITGEEITVIDQDCCVI